MTNEFMNLNCISWLRWIFLKSDNLPAVTFYFISRKNSTSPRFFPLYNQMKNLRIVLIKGTRYRYFDRVQLKLTRILISLTYKKVVMYDWVLDSGFTQNNPMTNQIINLDDPDYSTLEIRDIKHWENKILNRRLRSIIVVTSEYTKSYLLENGVSSEVHILPQGYTYSSGLDSKKFNRFSVVYSSPYIYSRLDKKFRSNSHWSVDLFIRQIIPKLIKADPFIDIVLIGRIGNSTRKFIENFQSVKLMGLVSVERSSQILSQCHLGLYPRTYDSYRQSQKISEYIGAELPVVTFNLTDASLVSDLHIGICVEKEDVEEFLIAIQLLKNSEELLKSYQKRIQEIKKFYSWTTLAQYFDELLLNKR